MKYGQKTFLEETFYVRSKFSCVRSSHDLCVHAHAHGLEETLARTVEFPEILPKYWDLIWRLFSYLWLYRTST